jgi:hypothetical protein
MSWERTFKADIRYGGHLLRKQQPSRNRFKFVLRCPNRFNPVRSTATG